MKILLPFSWSKPQNNFSINFFSGLPYFHLGTSSHPGEIVLRPCFKQSITSCSILPWMLEVARGPCSPTVTLAGVISVYSITSALKSVFYKVTHHSATPLPISTTGYKILFPSRPCQAAYGLFKATTTTASLGTACLGAVRNWFPLIHVWGCIGSWHGMAGHQVDLCLLLTALACASHSARLALHSSGVRDIRGHVLAPARALGAGGWSLKGGCRGELLRGIALW